VRGFHTAPDEIPNVSHGKSSIVPCVLRHGIEESIGAVERQATGKSIADTKKRADRAASGKRKAAQHREGGTI
jgi:hypothetical protein